MFRDSIGFAAIILAVAIALVGFADLVRAPHWMNIAAVVCAVVGFIILLAPGLARQCAKDAAGAERSLAIFMLIIAGFFWGSNSLSRGLDGEGGFLAAAHPELAGVQREIGITYADADRYFGGLGGARAPQTPDAAGDASRELRDFSGELGLGGDPIETASLYDTPAPLAPAAGALRLAAAQALPGGRARFTVRNLSADPIEQLEIVINEGDGARARRIGRRIGAVAGAYADLRPEVRVRDLGQPLSICAVGRRAGGGWVRSYAVFAPVAAARDGQIPVLRRDPSDAGPMRLSCR